MYRQRKDDRRDFDWNSSFPLITKGGYLVKEDRRIIPDRRLGNIHLEWIDAADYKFTEYFANTAFYTSGK
jgi:hypothetical protein